MNDKAFQSQQEMVQQLLAQIQEDSDPKAEIIQTHVSWVLLHNDTAWKIKKAITLPFLDYASNEQRRQCCERELALNSQSSQGIYRAVRTITRAPDGRLTIDAPNKPPLDYLVEMRRFPQSALLSNILAQGQDPATAEFGIDQLLSLAQHIGQFHLACPLATSELSGDFTATRQEIIDNFTALEQIEASESQQSLLQTVKTHTLDELDQAKPLINQRKAQNLIRLCHGDLHLGNLIWLDGAPQIFDRIEFSTSFSEIDPIKDLAFLYMDLISHGHPYLAAALIDTWAQTTQDYQGLRLLRLYAGYRAMVRAKIASIEAAQNPGKPSIAAQVWQRLELAARFIHQPNRCLVLMHGTTGTGKSQLAAHIAGNTDAIVLHSDVIRKQLHALPLGPVHDDSLKKRLYSPEATETTYARLAELTAHYLDSGLNVIVDASFLAQDRRQRFIDLANAKQADCLIASPQPVDGQQQQWLSERRTHPDRYASDGDEKVLEWQNNTRDPLNAQEQEIEWKVEATKPENTSRISKYIHKLDRLINIS